VQLAARAYDQGVQGTATTAAAQAFVLSMGASAAASQLLPAAAVADVGSVAVGCCSCACVAASCPCGSFECSKLQQQRGASSQRKK
jgi:hypothetical protein